MPEASSEPRRPSGPRPFWSGTLTFGLVSVPVQLYSANRSAGVSLRMVDEEGTPLQRRYICPAEDREVSRDELVRGYEIARNEFVVLTEDELEALEPKKSREIDLRRFVPVEELDPVFFERAYILTPGEGSTKAYRLLAETMERSGRAGVATFVMRSKEYLVAILAEHGILRAETMRFHDEIRSPDAIGLPEAPEPPKKKVDALVSAIEKAAEGELDPDELEDRRSEELEALAARKREAGEDVKEIPAEARDSEEDEGPTEIIDLMAVLRRSLAQGGGGEQAEGRQAGAGSGEAGEAKGRMPPTRAGRRGAGRGELDRMTKAELYERAKDLDVPGRSSMSKDELIEAIRERRRSA